MTVVSIHSFTFNTFASSRKFLRCEVNTPPPLPLLCILHLKLLQISPLMLFSDCHHVHSNCLPPPRRRGFWECSWRRRTHRPADRKVEAHGKRRASRDPLRVISLAGTLQTWEWRVVQERGCRRLEGWCSPVDPRSRVDSESCVRSWIGSGRLCVWRKKEWKKRMGECNPEQTEA